MTLFISYSSADAEVVSVLQRNLESFGKKVWRDKEVIGGQAWWAAILEQIRECDVFIFALSRNSLESDPCALEFGYAKALGVPILPVEIGEVPAESRRNHAVYSEQLVDYRNPTSDTAIALMRAVGEREASRKPLPDPLPPEPPIPYEYLLRLSSVIRMREPIPYPEQRQLIGEFRDALVRERNESVRASIRGLLNELKDRPETSHSVEAEIDELLAKFAPPSAAAATTAMTAAPLASVDPTHADKADDIPIAADPPVVVPPPPFQPPAYAVVPPPVPTAPATFAATGAAGSGPVPQPPPPDPRSNGGGRKLAIILGAVGAVVVVGAIAFAIATPMVINALARDSSPSPSATPTPTADPIECWDGNSAVGTDECAPFTGEDALLYAFLLDDGPDGDAADCDVSDAPEDYEAGAILVLDCTWADLDGTLVKLAEYELTPEEVQSHWEGMVWDEEFTWTVDDERIGLTWEAVSTIESGEVWDWAATYDDLPMSVEIFSFASLGGSPENVQEAWDRKLPLTLDEVEALPGVAQ